MINSPKEMIVIYILVASQLPRNPSFAIKRTFTVNFFVDNILADVVAAQPACDPYRRIVLLMDNVPSERALLTKQKLEEN
jgi:hypothetical protein